MLLSAGIPIAIKGNEVYMAMTSIAITMSNALSPEYILALTSPISGEVKRIEVSLTIPYNTEITRRIIKVRIITPNTVIKLKGKLVPYGGISSIIYHLPNQRYLQGIRGVLLFVMGRVM